MAKSSIASAFVQIVPSMDGTQKALEDGLNKEASGAGKTAGKTLGSSLASGFASAGQSITAIGATLTAAVTAPMTAIFAASALKAVDFVKTYESTMVTFERRLDGGSGAAKKLYNSLLDVAKASTFSQETFLKAGQYLVGIGLDADQTERYLRAAKDAVSAFGGSGADIEQLAEVMGQVANKGKITGLEINRFAAAGVNALQILATHYNVTTDEMREMISEGIVPGVEALDIITGALEETNEASAMFQYSVAGMGESLKGSTLTGALDSMSTSFRSFSLELFGLDPRIESNQDRLSGIVEVINMVNDVVPTLSKVFGFVPEAIDGATRAVKDFLRGFTQWVDNAPQEEVEALGKAIVTLAATGPVLLVFGKTISTVVKMATTMNLVGAVITAVATAVTLLGISSALAAKDMSPLTTSSKEQKAEVGKLEAAYNDAVSTCGEFSSEASRAKAAFDEASRSFKNNAQTVADLRNEISDTSQKFKDMKADLYDQQSAASAAHGGLLLLVDRYEELTRQAANGADVQEELSRVTKQLGESDIPGMSEAYDAATGTINLTTGAMRGLINAALDQAQVAAMTKFLEDAYGELYTAQVQAKEASETLTGVIRDEAIVQGELEQKLVDGIMTNEEYIRQVEISQKKVEEATEADRLARDAVQDKTAAINNLNDDLNNIKITQAEYAESTAELRAKVGENYSAMVDEVGSNRERYGNVLAGMSDMTAEELDRMHAFFEQKGMNASAAFVFTMMSMDDTLKAEMPRIGADVAEGLADGISDSEAAELSALGLSEEVIAQMRDTFGCQSPATSTIAIGGDVVAGLAQGLDKSGPATQSSGNLGNSVLSTLSGIISPGNMSNVGALGAAGFGAGVGTGKGAAKGNAETVANAAAGGMQSQNKNSSTWGDHLVSGMAAGISGAVQFVRDAATGIANTIASILHFTRPDEGPLREYETWMPHMVEGLASSLRAAAPELSREAEYTAELVAEAFDRDYTLGAIGVEELSSSRRASSQPHTAEGGSGNNYSIGNVTYTPDSRIAQIMDDLFAEVARTQRMGVRA